MTDRDNPRTRRNGNKAEGTQEPQEQKIMRRGRKNPKGFVLMFEELMMMTTTARTRDDNISENSFFFSKNAHKNQHVKETQLDFIKCTTCRILRGVLMGQTETDTQA